MSAPRVVRAAGALAEVAPLGGAALHELVRVGQAGLLGEVIRLSGDTATVQLFEETAGLSLGEEVAATGSALTAELGPGLAGAVLDGVGRPLERVAEGWGDFLPPGTEAATLPREVRWTFAPSIEAGRDVAGGDVLGTVEERGGLEHRILVPPGTSGILAGIEAGDYAVDEPVAVLEDGSPLFLAHSWPVRLARPVEGRIRGDRPMVTGQRVFDLLFPVAEGGTVAVPGGFGTGKTVIEQTLARYAAADVVVYVGCGERGNEMAEVLEEFPGLEDPRSGGSIMDRTVLVVNTSNMPVAAREASTYLGMTIAEYYRDMGHRVALLSDSLSRWAEALREIASRLHELPGEEGYPTYLASRLGALFERSGRCRARGRPEREGAVTFIAAVSPPGGDFSEPVTQASLRAAGALWALDPELAHQRQFPAVDWEVSYSLYVEPTAAWFREEVSEDWPDLRREVLVLLETDRELREVAGLVGPDALEDSDRLALEVARLVRELLVGQSAVDPADAYSPLARTHALASLLVSLRREAGASLEAGTPLEALELGPFVRALGAVRRADPAELGERVDEARAALAEVTRATRPAVGAREEREEPTAGEARGPASGTSRPEGEP
ncbi:MAG TPA: V-type ATP synthase subunit A [Gemmatimonadota bacterium]|nr:V-type ATP synthase subunit A [Gemmatimonadota bacterium]